MFNYHKKLEKIDIGGGILFQNHGKGVNMNFWHWDLQDRGVVSLHQHESEQFGYVIKGGFEIIAGKEKSIIQAGDSYVIPSNVPHQLRAIGETEAIDVFSPSRPDEDIPQKK
jgi:quercetin dioxygenase-like cupin family protein